ncbi:class I SAM-dependent methyltransferase [Pseudactinotalea sp.]|uniref:class I SAM-dependent methyltransferase n=1 Tax=Pseudactinotalea sp. TaxID=1926260 RepID=UPI003B3ADC49
MADPMHFEQHAASYDEARPPYPPELWQRIAELGGLRPGLRAVDLGAGSGQATRVLLAAGLDVTAVEPGEQLAVQIRTRYPAAQVLESTAEAAELGQAVFDVAVVATAIHWMDLDVLLPRLHRALAPGGLLLVFRNVYGDETAEVTSFRARVAEIVARRHAPSRRGLEVGASTEDALTRGGLFETISHDDFSWEIDLDEHQIRLLFGTFSDWSAAEVEEAALAVRDLGGSVTEHYRSWLIALRRT